MLTIMLETHDHEAELAQTLSALVSGAVEGLVSDVIILDHGSRDGCSRVADAAGCRFLVNWDIKDVVRSVRGEWLMLLEAGARPSGRWIDDVAEYIGLNKAPARFSASRLHRKPFFKRIGRRPAALENGFLLSKRQAIASAKTGMPLADFAKGHSVRKLSTEIIPAWVAVGNRPRPEDI
jgi:hypothetical protein